LDDAAQAFGASYKGRRLGTVGVATGTSFFPAKPLGCYGDGGAVFTEDGALAETLASLRVHGQGSDKYDNVNIGINGRLDTLQAAVLLEKLRIFPEEMHRRQQVAERYDAALADVAIVPKVPPGLTSVWAQYTIRVPPQRRDILIAALREQGVPTAIYYPKPLHRQTAYRGYPVAGNGGLSRKRNHRAVDRPWIRATQIALRLENRNSNQPTKLEPSTSAAIVTGMDE
jgi:dTDP-4-amino-4,6-dideoxygalactose transaminase